MSTRTKSRKDFKELLQESREIMGRHLAGELPDLSDPTVQAHLTPEESLVYSHMEENAGEARSRLFAMGRRHGLSKREITLALLRPMARILRPTLPTGGCFCPRCQLRRSAA